MKSPLGSGSADKISISRAPSKPAREGGALHDVQDGEEEIKRIDAALRRLEHGVFGLCLYCGDQISMKRLDRNPAIMSCSVCDED